MRILIITNMIPYPPVSGAQVRIYNLLRRIAERHQVWLATHLHTPDEAEGVSHLQEFCHHVATGILRRRHPIAHLPGLLRYAVAGKPLELKFKHSEELACKIRHLFSEVDFDIVQIEESCMALYLETLLPDAQSKRILMFYDIGFKQAARFYPIERNLMMKWRTWLYSRMMRRWEPRYAERFDCCITVSEVDRRLLMMANPRLQVNVVPNGVDTQVHQPLPHEGTSPALLFVGGMNYTPSSDAVLYFCGEILPRIRRVVPDVEMWIVGRDPLPEVMRLSSDDMHVTGQVDDVVPYYRRSTVCVVPLRAGGGTRLKILEAMALGRSVVSTTIGCEGLDVVDGKHLLVADNPERFAEQTVRLLTDRALYERITTNARRLVVSHYDWDAIAEQMMQIYAEVIE
jgi:sugar transferase (PEP-CTERM/EpsH1 system associated)